MLFANRFSINRRPDHLFIRFGLSDAGDEDPGTEVAVVAIPLTVSTELGLKLFEAVFHSVSELQVVFGKFQNQVIALNTLSEAQKRAQAMAEQKKAEAGGTGT